MVITNTTYNIRSSSNGFIIDKSWSEDTGTGPVFKSNLTIFSLWDDVVTWCTNNPIDMGT